MPHIAPDVPWILCANTIDSSTVEALMEPKSPKNIGVGTTTDRISLWFRHDDTTEYHGTPLITRFCFLRRLLYTAQGPQSASPELLPSRETPTALNRIPPSPQTLNLNGPESPADTLEPSSGSSGCNKVGFLLGLGFIVVEPFKEPFQGILLGTRVTCEGVYIARIPKPYT